MHKHILVAVVFAVAPVILGVTSGGQVALAQTVVTTPSGEAAPGPFSELVKSLTGTPNEVVSLTLNKTLELKLPSAVRDVIVGSPAIADVVVRSPTQLFLVGKAIGDTNVFLLDAEGKIIERFEVNVHPDTDSVKQTLAGLLPGEPIDVTGAGNAIVLSGTVSSDGVVQRASDVARRFVDEDAKIVNMLRVANEQQVMLRVRVSEVSKTAIKNLGIDWNLSNIALGNGAINAVLPGAASAITTPATISGVATDLGPIGSLDVTLSMLEQQNLAKNLAEPNLVTVSGEVANILVGGETPIPTAQDNNSITVEFKPFGVALSFLPVVLDSGRISLKVGTEVSALDVTNQVTLCSGCSPISGLKVRRANSVVELPSGGSIMLGGLLSNDITSGLTGLPGAMNIPILGQLFRSNAFQHNETELVITVTALLVKPVQPKLLSVPTDGFAPASDLDNYFLGHLQNIYVKQPVPTGHNAPALQGPIGYIIQ
ncbi:type II and III secretion system protein family protein [Dongia sedimenti]|uniref:Type II and III secretion system protein family protein n=1 Tax=Dongia sedimenti TaxID=3064282 RepID=A0ABU0YST4_9PROT|nr:type II and III secretion system protein family protein [Rhodospirillaceae bacterium R-7]